ncbi:hypothetical protein D0B32_24185 [Paraburkholderia sp. DHOC27]|nr:hypothetical protein D0B32_24185 [Paraburkholderia sp. DHOC27]
MTGGSCRTALMWRRGIRRH